MRIGVVTRNDTSRIAGGDAIMLHNIRKQIALLGVEMQSIPVDELEQFRGNALHLTQLYQLDVAEAALSYAKSKHIPIFASPLFEEHMAIWFRQAIRKPGKWHRLASMFGRYPTELVYQQWQTIRRIRSEDWQRQRRIIERTHLVPNSRYELQHLSRWFALPNLAATIIPLGVDPDLYGDVDFVAEEFATEFKRLQGRYILQVGVISMRKNQDGLLRALMDTDLPIVFLGQPSPYEPEYCQEVTVLARRRKNVTFLNQVHDTTLLALYRGAGLHILPSWSERPGLVTLEAAACGCKVVSTNRSPIYEYLADRAWYCNPSESPSIMQAVQEALNKPVPSDLSSYVLNQFTWQRTAERLREVYESILSI